MSTTHVPERLEAVDPSLERKPHPEQVHYCSETGNAVTPICFPELGDGDGPVCYCPVTGERIT
ncbi:hypothetical protein [Halalkaliarchaeum desulfuricum]|nr:hypothetical protein [Halalkaliarchaeum desulfuricum]